MEKLYIYVSICKTVYICKTIILNEGDMKNFLDKQNL